MSWTTPKRNQRNEINETKSMCGEKQIVCIASTMRSGSTLLKALLAEADDVANLPEVNFQKYSGDSDAAKTIGELDASRIVLLKRPAWYNELNSYPRLPKVESLKVILLVRDVYDTVQSCRKMTFSKAAGLASLFADRWLANRYWASITASLLDLHQQQHVETRLIRYEDLVADPIKETKTLFEFIGSEQEVGIDKYSRPDDFKWRWGRDDGSPNIRSLQVQPPKDKPKTNERLLKIIESSETINELRHQLKFA